MGTLHGPTRSQSPVQRPHAQRPQSQYQQGHGALLGAQETRAAARGPQRQSLQCPDPVDGDVGDQKPTRTLPEGNRRGDHGAGDRVPVRPVGRPRSHAYWDGEQWVLTPDAALRFKEKYRRARGRQNERRRITRHMLKKMEEPKIKQTTLDKWA